MGNKGLLGIISIVLIAIGCYFCLFLSSSSKGEGDSYLLPSSVTTTQETTSVTTQSQTFNGIEKTISFTEQNEDVHLSLSNPNSDKVRFTTDDMANATWSVTKTKNLKGEQCYLYSVDSENALVLTIVPGCSVTQPANVQVSLNNRIRNIKVYIE